MGGDQGTSGSETISNRPSNDTSSVIKAGGYVLDRRAQPLDESIPPK